MLHHVELYVRNLAESRKFYDFLLPKLGYSLFQEWTEGFSYRQEQHYLVFVQVKKKYQRNTYHRRHVGLNHLAFHGGSRQDVEQLKIALSAFDIKFLYEESYPYAGGLDYFAVYFEDPDRIKIEIVAERNHD